MENTETKKTNFKKTNKFTKQLGLISVIIVLCIVFTISNSTFMTVDNLLNIVRQSSTMIIVAIGLTFVMIAGELDLSIGGVACLSGIITSLALKSGVNIGLSVILGLCIGVIFGLLNGMITTKFKLPSMIVTLATMNLANGAASLITGGTAIYGLPKGFEFFGRGYIGFLPSQVIFMIAIVIVSTIVLTKTVFGRYTFAIGGNETVAKLAGIDTSKYKVAYFIICSLCASFVGIILTSRLASGQPNLAANMSMDTITAVVIGGTAMAGGDGSVEGSMLGALFLTIISNGLTINGISSFWQMIISAIILVITIIVRREK